MSYRFQSSEENNFGYQKIYLHKSLVFRSKRIKKRFNFQSAHSREFYDSKLLLGMLRPNDF